MPADADAEVKVSDKTMLTTKAILPARFTDLMIAIRF
jgi:hypothetical protein